MYNIHTKYTTLPRGVGGFPVLQFLWKIKKMYTLYNLHFFFLYKNLQSAKQDIYTVISVSFVFYDIEKYWKKPQKVVHWEEYQYILLFFEITIKCGI